MLHYAELSFHFLRENVFRSVNFKVILLQVSSGEPINNKIAVRCVCTNQVSYAKNEKVSKSGESLFC